MFRGRAGYRLICILVLSLAAVLAVLTGALVALHYAVS